MLLKSNRSAGNNSSFFENLKPIPEKCDEKTVILTAQEAADFLKMPLGSLRNLTSDGKIPYYKIGRRVRYLKSDLIALLFKKQRS